MAFNGCNDCNLIVPEMKRRTSLTGLALHTSHSTIPCLIDK